LFYASFYGIWFRDPPIITDTSFNICVKCFNPTYDCLGGHFGHDISKCQRSNIEKQLQKTKEIINNWNKRNVSILGNITVMKSLLLPNITTQLQNS
jgi:hypothetical protein